MIKEVIKMSALEYQKGEGKIDLAHIKRKKEPIENEFRKNGSNFTNGKINAKKMISPRDLPPVIFGNSKPGHAHSTNTMGI